MNEADRGLCKKLQEVYCMFQLVTPGEGPLLTPGTHEQTW